MIVRDQPLVVICGARGPALVVHDDQLDRVAEQAAVGVHVAGPQLVALEARLAVGLEPLCLLGAGQWLGDPDRDRGAGGACGEVAGAGVADPARGGDGGARGRHRREPEGLGLGAPHLWFHFLFAWSAGTRGARSALPRSAHHTVSPGPRLAWD